MIVVSTDIVVEKGAKFIKYDSGFMICFDEVVLSAGSTKEVAFPVAFKDDDSVIVSVSPYWNVSGARISNIYKNKFYVDITLSSQTEGRICYTAHGWWK